MVGVYVWRDIFNLLPLRDCVALQRTCRYLDKALDREAFDKRILGGELLLRHIDFIFVYRTRQGPCICIRNPVSKGVITFEKLAVITLDGVRSQLVNKFFQTRFTFSAFVAVHH